MADNSTVEAAIEPAAAKPSKGFMKSFFDFFGGRALRHIFLPLLYHDISDQADPGNHRPGIFYWCQIVSDCDAGRLFHRHGAGLAAVFRAG
jgi:hypothetical protein